MRLEQGTAKRLDILSEIRSSYIILILESIIFQCDDVQVFGYGIFQNYIIIIIITAARCRRFVVSLELSKLLLKKTTC